jgi:hypothetical protein
MKRLVGFLLAASVSLYSTPLKADSYENNQDIFADDSSVDSDQQCQVTPAEASSEEQDTFLQQDASTEQNVNESSEEQIQMVDSDQESDTETYVTPENPSQKRGQTGRWKNILLAVVVVAVAITALLIVNSNKGSKKSH